MDIERINSVLTKAIVNLQSAEIEGMTEAAYKPKSPAAFGFKPKKAKKECSHRNKKGDFDSFNDCVKHLTKCKGKKPEDAKGICGGVMFGGRKQKKSDSDVTEAIVRGKTGSYNIPSPSSLAKRSSGLSREDELQMYKDVIALKKSKGEPVPREWLRGMAELEAGQAKGAKSGWVYSNKVFGHPEVTGASFRGYQNLVPIKVRSGDVKAIEKRIGWVQKKLSKLQKETAVIDARARGRMGTPAQKRAAKKKVKTRNFTDKLAVIDMLRGETMKELLSLRKELSKGG